MPGSGDEEEALIRQWDTFRLTAVGARGHKLGPEFAPGLILTDMVKKSWRLGKAIGRGGFGIIYLASDDIKATSDDKHGHVIKMEPIGNGPLFCEMYFYQRACKPEMIDEWMRTHRLRHLGIPKFHGTGQHDQSHRFLVIPRCGPDLQSLLTNAGGRLAPEEVFAIGVRMIDCLEYIHSKEYVHADVKAANILMGWKNNHALYSEVYLMDYGLAYRYLVDDVHVAYKEDPKRKHDGTVEFCSRDAHNGLRPSRRGDLETLGFCMLQWLMGSLPWESLIANKNKVSDEKNRYMDNLKLLKGKPFPGQDTIIAYLEMVKRLRYDENPNYQRFRSLLSDGLRKLGASDDDLNLAHYADDGKGKKRKWETTGDSASKSSKIASAAARGRSATPKGRGKKASPKRGAASPDLSSPEPPARKKPASAKAAVAGPSGDATSSQSRKKTASPAARGKAKASRAGTDIIPGAPQASSATPRSGASIIPGAARKASAPPKTGADIIPGIGWNKSSSSSTSGAGITPGQSQSKKVNPADIIPGAPNGSVRVSSAPAGSQASKRRVRRKNSDDCNDVGVQTSPAGTSRR